jgi:hypothetical protein
MSAKAMVYQSVVPYISPQNLTVPTIFCYLAVLQKL